jgi:Tfp pilus assembly protein PilF
MANYSLAQVKKAKGDNLGAMQDINEALKTYSNSIAAFLMRAKIKLAIGSKKTACEDLKEALKYAAELKYEDDNAEITKLIKENCQ